MVDRHCVWGMALATVLAACGDDPKRDSGEASPPDCFPVADAGPDQTVSLGEAVTLDASASQPCDETAGAATYTWILDSVPAASQLDDAALSENNSVEAMASSFGPDTVGTYLLTLQVDQGEWSSQPDVVVVEVTTSGEPPVADCRSDVVVELGELAELDGSGSSDPDGDALSYAWTIGAVPAGSDYEHSGVFGSDNVEASFLPDLVGTYSVYLVVSDGQHDSEPAYCTVNAVRTDEAPIADAGVGGIVPPCDDQIVPLDAYGSYDPEGQPITYQWGVLETPEGSGASAEPCDTGAACYLAFDDSTAPDAIFTWDIEGSYTLQLVVSDGYHLSIPDAVVYTVSDCP